MVKQDASASDALPHPAQLASDIWRFIHRPQLSPVSMPWSGRMLALLATIIAFDFMLNVGCHFLLGLIDAMAWPLPQLRESNASIPQLLLSMLILAPLVEEALFRGWLSGRKASRRFALFGFAAFLIILSGELAVMQPYLTPIIVSGFALAGGGFIQWLFTHKRDGEVPEWFVRHFRWFVWGSAAAFGLFHLGNYEGYDSVADLLVIAPLVMGGLLLAYSRVRFGLRAAMLHHAGYNALFLLSEHLF